MVDSTKGIGPIQGSVPSRPTAASNEKRAEEKKKAEQSQDKVEISQKALSQAQAEQAASDVRGYLERDPGQTLGLNPSLLDQKV